MKRKYIHYGGAFDKNKFAPIRNMEYINKPMGGFWASPVDTEWGWKDWCKSENFRVSKLTDAFVFELKDGAKVFEINSGDDVLKMPMQSTDITITTIKPIDFEAMLSQGVDAIEFNYTLCPSLYWELYGWDCDSLLVLNPDIIVSTE